MFWPDQDTSTCIHVHVYTVVSDYNIHVYMYTVVSEARDEFVINPRSACAARVTVLGL